MNWVRPGPACWLVACTVLASCAGGRTGRQLLDDYRPAPRSTLLSSPGAEFVLAQSQYHAVQTTVLARREGDGGVRPVARLVHRQEGSHAHVTIEPDAQALAGARRAAERAVLEQLYTLVLRMDPLASYCLQVADTACEASGSVSHTRVLQMLAEARAQAVDDGSAIVPWRVVDMTSAPLRTWDVDVVGVRAVGRDGPLEGVSIYFNRAPHSLCIARTGADGVATCRLQDQHGDEHQHDHAASVVAIFPGDVRPERILPPTTFVLPAPKGLRAPFILPRLP